MCRTALGRNGGEWWDEEYGLLFKVIRKNGPDVLDYPNPRIFASARLSSEDIGINWNTVPPLELITGTPTYIIVAEMLRQETLGEAQYAVLKSNRAGCFSFVITDDT